MKENNCYGKCYLSKQLKKAAEKEKKETENLREKQELVYLNSISEKTITPSYLMESSKLLFSHHCEKTKSIAFSIFRPPLA